MYTVIVAATKGKSGSLKSEASTWKELSKEIVKAGYELSGKVVHASGSVRDVGMSSPTSQIPVHPEKQVVLLSITDAGAKGGLESAITYDLDTKWSDIQELSYKDAGALLKNIRLQAAEKEDERILDTVGNYSNLSTVDRIFRIQVVYRFLGLAPQESAIDEDTVKELVQAELEQVLSRISTIELRVGIVNEHNQKFWLEEVQQQMERVKLKK